MTKILNIITSGQDIGNVLSVASELGYVTKIVECNLNLNEMR